MTAAPFILPKPVGKKTIADNLEQGALFHWAENDQVYAFRGVLPDQRWALYLAGNDPRPLLLADPTTGFPAFPTHEQIISLMAASKLQLMSNTLDTPARNRARSKERTKDEVLTKDPYAEVRMMICRLYDKERPPLDDMSLSYWLEERFDWQGITHKFQRGRPAASTARSWIRRRGRPNNRCWADMEDCQGEGPRRQKVVGVRLAIAVWHAASYWTARRHSSVRKTYNDMEADVHAFNSGDALIMHDGVRTWPKPDTPIDPADREFFRQLVKRMESRTSYKHRFSAAAAQQRWEGGGSAVEPVRFLEVAQQDETDAGAWFFVDSINRIPLGAATSVINVDVKTGCVLACDLSFDTPSKISWMRNILNSTKYKALPKEYAERFPELSTICGRISSQIFDNPQHYIALAVEDAHGDCVQDVIYAGEGQPTHKAMVERTHEILRKLFAEELPGSKMSIALSREFNIDPSKETVVSLHEAQLALSRAICRLHTEIKDDDGRTRLDRWIEEFERWGPQHARDQEQFARAIGDVTIGCALDNGGIVNNYLEYSDRVKTPILLEHYAQHSHLRRKCKKPTFDAKIKWDPTDLSCVFVFDPVLEKYVRLPAKRKRYTQGLTLAMHNLVRRHRTASSLMASPEGERKLCEIRRIAELELSKLSPKMEARELRARAAIMQQPIIRKLMGEDIGLVMVHPSVTGMEVKHDLGFGRSDQGQIPVRSKRGSQKNNLQSGSADEAIPNRTNGEAPQNVEPHDIGGNTMLDDDARSDGLLSNKPDDAPAQGPQATELSDHDEDNDDDDFGVWSGPY